MFRVQRNVPEVYVNESRDFQLLSRLYDCWQGSVNYNVLSMVNSLEPTTALDRVLELLATRVGFFPRVHLDANILRYIIASFPYILKNKGTSIGIREAVYAIMKAEVDPKATEEVVIRIDNDDRNVTIATQNDIYNKIALREVMRYVLPFGYTYSLVRYTSNPSPENKLVINEEVNTKEVKTTESSAIQTSEADKANCVDTDGLRGTYNMGVIPGSKDFAEDSN